MAATASPLAQICGDDYKLTQDQVSSFYQNGYLTLSRIVTDDELAGLEKVFDEFNEGKRGVDLGRDFGDHSQGHGTARKNFNMINVNVPCAHDPSWANNIFERRAFSITKQLYGEGMKKDYEQLLTKLPNRPKAVFPFHQDMAYWPKRSGQDTRTATVSLALNAANEDNGCLLVLPSSHKSKSLYGAHEDFGKNKDEKGDTRAIVLKLTAEDEGKIVPLPVVRGGCTIHEEWIVHGSGGNGSDGPRKTYVVAFRDERMIEYERKNGFNHSYNDDPSVIEKIRGGEL